MIAKRDPRDFPIFQLLICMHKFPSAATTLHLFSCAFESYLIQRFSLSTQSRLILHPPPSSHPPRAPLISGSIPLEINICNCGVHALVSRHRRFVNHTPKATNLQESTKDTELFKARRNYIFSTTRVVLEVLLC